MSGTWIAEMSIITCLGFIHNPVLYSHTCIPTEIMLETTHAQKHILKNSIICHFWCVVSGHIFSDFLTLLVTFVDFNPLVTVNDSAV